MMGGGNKVAGGRKDVDWSGYKAARRGEGSGRNCEGGRREV